MPSSRARDALLSALIDDGRASVEALARVTGLSSTRVRQLLAELDGDHVQVRGIIHPAVFGQHALAHLQVTTRGPQAPLVDALVANPAVPYVTLVAADFGVAAEVRVGTRSDLVNALDEIRALPSVAHVEVDEYSDVVKDALVRLSPVGDTALDSIDRRLLARLQDDGRESYASLARRVSLTTASVRARVLRLIETGVVRIGVRQRARTDSMQVGFRVAGRGQADVAEALLARPAIEYLAASVGRSSFLGTLRVPSPGEAAVELEAVRRIDQVVEVQSWMHLTVVKERYETQSPSERDER